MKRKWLKPVLLALMICFSLALVGVGGFFFAGCTKDKNAGGDAISTAQWKADGDAVTSITINFTYNGGTSASYVETEFNNTGSSTDTTVTKTSNFTMYRHKLTNLQSSLNGRTWNVLADDIYVFNGESSSSTSGIGISPTARKTFLATKSGYTLNGFYKSSSGGTQLIDSTGAFTSSAYSTSSTTWYARFTANTTYTITIAIQNIDSATAPSRLYCDTSSSRTGTYTAITAVPFTTSGYLNITSTVISTGATITIHQGYTLRIRTYHGTTTSETAYVAAYKTGETTTLCSTVDTNQLLHPGFKYSSGTLYSSYYSDYMYITPSVNTTLTIYSVKRQNRIALNTPSGTGTYSLSYSNYCGVDFTSIDLAFNGTSGATNWAFPQRGGYWDGWFRSENHAHNSVKTLKLTFKVPYAMDLKFQYFNQSEANYDYAWFSKLDTAFTAPGSTTNETDYQARVAEKAGTYGTVTYSSVSAGTHTIYVKYKKDGSQSYGADGICFRPLFNYSFGGTYTMFYYPQDGDGQFSYFKVGSIIKGGYTFSGWYSASSGGSQYAAPGANLATSTARGQTYSLVIWYPHFALAPYTIYLQSTDDSVTTYPVGTSMSVYHGDTVSIDVDVNGGDVTVSTDGGLSIVANNQALYDGHYYDVSWEIYYQATGTYDEDLDSFTFDYTKGDVYITFIYLAELNFEASPTSYGSVDVAQVLVPIHSTRGSNGNVLTITGPDYYLPGHGYMTNWSQTVTATPAASTSAYTYSFSYWSIDSGEVNQSETTYAYFNRTGVARTVTANANGGTIASTSGWTGTGSTATKSIRYGSQYGTLPSVSKSNYTLDGWHLNSASGTTITSSTSMTTASNHTIYAKWVPTARTITIKSYYYSYIGAGVDGLPSGAYLKVTYTKVENGTTSYQRNISQTNASTDYSAHQGTEFTLEDTYAPGYVFVGLKKGSATGTGVSTSFFVASNTTYYAVFREAKTRITYDGAQKYYYIIDGEYPQSYVGDTLNSTLNSTTLTATDRTFNMGYETAFAYLYSGNYYIKQQAMGTYTIDLMYHGSSTLSETTFTSGTWYWFKVEPIRWRISNYGVTSGYTYGTNINNVYGISDIMGYGQLASSVGSASGIGSSADNLLISLSQDGTVFAAGTSGDSSAVIELDSDLDTYNTTGNITKVTTTNHNFVQSSTGTPNLITASLKDIRRVTTDLTMYASGYTAFCMGLDADKCYAWTRNLYDIGSVYVIAPGGTRNQCWVDSSNGYVFAHKIYQAVVVSTT